MPERSQYEGGLIPMVDTSCNIFIMSFTRMVVKCLKASAAADKWTIAFHKLSPGAWLNLTAISPILTVLTVSAVPRLLDA